MVGENALVTHPTVRNETSNLQIEARLTEEEKVVAELELLGIRYLSRQLPFQARQARSAEALLADLVQQPSARVRTAVIALLLAHPDYAQAVPAALEQLQPGDRLTLRLFYTAAVLLQQEYADRLRAFVGAKWQRLPDLFSGELGLESEGVARHRLMQLGAVHRHRTGAVVNWVGTYDSAARHLLRQWELERQWSR